MGEYIICIKKLWVISGALGQGELDFEVCDAVESQVCVLCVYQA